LEKNLPRLQEVLGQFVIDALGNPLTTTKFGNAVFAGAVPFSGCLSQVTLLGGYDEPTTLC